MLEMGKNNSMDVVSFLFRSAATLPNAQDILEHLNRGDENEDGGYDDDSDIVTMNNDLAIRDDNKSKIIPPQGDDYLQTMLRSLPLSPFVEVISVCDNTHKKGLQIEVSCITPRGKFILELRQCGIILTNPKNSNEKIYIHEKNVENVVWFRKMEDYKKLQQIQQTSGKLNGSISGPMVLICLKSIEEDSSATVEKSQAVMFRNKVLKQVCFQTPLSSQTKADGIKQKQFTEEQWFDGFSTSLFSQKDKDSGIVVVHTTMDSSSHSLSLSHGNSSNFTFQSEAALGSATTTQNMPFVSCYHGMNDGILFPLPEGLLFFKPPLFIPCSKLVSISCGRGVGNSSRFIDINIQLDSNDSLEFTNIHREELGVLNKYIHQVLIPAMQDDLKRGENVDEYSESNVKKSDEKTDQKEIVRVSHRPLRNASKLAASATRSFFQTLNVKKEQDSTKRGDKLENNEDLLIEESDDSDVDFSIGVSDNSSSDEDVGSEESFSVNDEWMFNSENSDDESNEEKCEREDEESNDKSCRKWKKARSSIN